MVYLAFPNADGAAQPAIIYSKMIFQDILKYKSSALAFAHIGQTQLWFHTNILKERCSTLKPTAQQYRAIYSTNLRLVTPKRWDSDVSLARS